MKKIVGIVLSFAMLMSVVACSTQPSQETVASSETVAQTEATQVQVSSSESEKEVKESERAPVETKALSTLTLEGIEAQEEVSNYVVIKVKDRGMILVKLFPEVAPVTVKNFQDLVEQKFYNGLIFHRIVPDFVIQGGDPLGSGLGGSNQHIVGEFLDNGHYNPLNHTRGVLSMARSQDPNSASSQFFIVLDASAAQHLNGRYAAFGYVLHGMGVVDQIAQVERNASDKPLEDVVMEEVFFVNEAFAKRFE